MGLFRKKEHVHFERDEAGNVIKTTRNGVEVSPEPMMKTSKQLEREYYEKHPEKKHPGLQKVGHGLKRLDTAIVKYNRTRNPLMKSPGHTIPSRSNRNPIGSMFDFGMTPPKQPKKQKSGGKKYILRDGKAYPIAGTGKKKKKSKKKSTGFGMSGNMDYWGLMK